MNSNEIICKRTEPLYEIIKNDEYILWFEDFMSKYTCISMMSASRYPKRYCNYDKEQIKKLLLLFDIISIYAKNNYIYPKNKGSSSYYCFKYNNIGYKIYSEPRILGNNVICNRVEIHTEEDFIDFNCILKQQNRDNVQYIEENLVKLSELINSLFEENVPIEAVKTTTENTIKRVLKK